MRPAADTVVVVLFLAVGLMPARAQDRLDVRVTTNLPEAVVFADSVLVGHAGDGVLSVPVQARSLRALAPQRDTWSIAPVVVPMEAAVGGAAVDLSFPYYYSVESTPFGAEVTLETASGSTSLGRTPLVHRSDHPLDGQLVVERPGYQRQRVSPGRDVWNAYNVTLEARRDLQAAAAEVDWRPPRRTRRWIDAAALGTAAVAGALAIHYKFRADRLYGEYEETTDPALRARIDRYDLYSGVALGTMQVGLGVFAVRLVLR